MSIHEDILEAVRYLGDQVRERFDNLEERLKTMGSGLAELQAADAALATEVAAFLADVVTALQNALGSGDSDAAVQQVATDIQAQITNLQNGDPVTGLTPGN